VSSSGHEAVLLHVHMMYRHSVLMWRGWLICVCLSVLSEAEVAASRQECIAGPHQVASSCMTCPSYIHVWCTSVHGGVECVCLTVLTQETGF
jgi:hypothetical protein